MLGALVPGDDELVAVPGRLPAPLAYSGGSGPVMELPSTMLREKRTTERNTERRRRVPARPAEHAVQRRHAADEHQRVWRGGRAEPFDPGCVDPAGFPVPGASPD